MTLVSFSASCNKAACCLAPSTLGEEAPLPREQTGHGVFGRGTGDTLLVVDTFPSPCWISPLPLVHALAFPVQTNSR